MLQSTSSGGKKKSSTTAFLRALWPDPPEGFFLLWLRANKRSLWFPSGNLEDLAAAAVKHAARTDVYVGCGLSPSDNGPNNRCKADDVIAIPGLWADVDIQGDAHKKKELPPDADSALSLIQKMPLPASLVVYTGHGLQPWWLFKEPWIFESEEERRQAAALLIALQAHLHTLAEDHGWKLDAVHDLARILRPPGTKNHKVDPVVPVTATIPVIIPRYDPSDLRDALPEVDKTSRNGYGPRRDPGEWERVSAGVDEGERHESGVAFIGKILGMVRDLSNPEQTAFAWSLVKDWNSRCSPAQPEEDLRRDFDDIYNREWKKREQAAPESWDPPTPLGEVPEPDPFPLDVLPAPAKQLVEEIAWAMNCAPDLAALALLSLAGGAIANSRHIAITDTHTQPPCLYAVVIAPPGAVKSPPLRLLRRPFDLMESQFRKAHKAAMEKWREADKEDRGPKPLLKRCLLSNTTTESWKVILDENPRGVLLIRNELSGLVAGLNQYKGGIGDDRQFIIDLWDGTPIIDDRKSDRLREGMPVFVLDAFTGIYGTMQPDVVWSMRSDAGRKRAGVDDGWLDRFLLSFPRDLPSMGEQWRVVSTQTRSAWEDAVNELLSLAMQERNWAIGRSAPSYCVLVTSPPGSDSSMTLPR
jgi:hypothetical protein